MGLTASLSMAGSEYLSTKTEGGTHPIQAAYTTGFAYVFTVICLVTPFFVFSSAFAAISVTIAIALLIILFFTSYLSVVKDYEFFSRFLEMAAISLGVAAVSFGIGFAIKEFFGLQI